MQRAPFKTVERYLRGLDPQSGDAMLTKAFWNVVGIGPTDPGQFHLISSIVKNPIWHFKGELRKEHPWHGKTFNRN